MKSNRGQNDWQEELLGRLGVLLGESRGVHLVVVAEPYLSLLIEGKKTVESRFSTTRRAPWGCVQDGDLLLLKKPSGPVVGLAKVGRVWSHEIGKPKTLLEIQGEFNDRVCGTTAFWASCKHAKYATLIEVMRAHPMNSVQCAKRDQRGWVVLRQGA